MIGKFERGDSLSMPHSLDFLFFSYEIKIRQRKEKEILANVEQGDKSGLRGSGSRKAQCYLPGRNL